MTSVKSKPVNNFTEYFKEERDIYVQNVSNCQVSVMFNIAPGHTESYLFTNSKDPVNLTRYIPFAAVKQSMDLRKMLNRSPPALRLLTEEENLAHYQRMASTHGLKSVDDAIEMAEERRLAIQNKLPLDNAPDPVKLHEVVEDDMHLGGKKVVKSLDVASEEEQINARVLNLCLQVHPKLDDQQKITAQQFMAELDSIDDLKLDDWAYIQSHGYYKSVKTLAKKKIADSISSESEEAPVKKVVKKKAQAEVEEG